MTTNATKQITLVVVTMVVVVIAVLLSRQGNDDTWPGFTSSETVVLMQIGEVAGVGGFPAH